MNYDTYEIASRTENAIARERKNICMMEAKERETTTEREREGECFFVGV